MSGPTIHAWVKATPNISAPLELSSDTTSSSSKANLSEQSNSTLEGRKIATNLSSFEPSVVDKISTEGKERLSLSAISNESDEKPERKISYPPVTTSPDQYSHVESNQAQERSPAKGIRERLLDKVASQFTSIKEKIINPKLDLPELDQQVQPAKKSNLKASSGQTVKKSVKFAEEVEKLTEKGLAVDYTEIKNYFFDKLSEKLKDKEVTIKSNDKEVTISLITLIPLTENSILKAIQDKKIKYDHLVVPDPEKLKAKEINAESKAKEINAKSKDKKVTRSPLRQIANSFLEAIKSKKTGNDHLTTSDPDDQLEAEVPYVEFEELIPEIKEELKSSIKDKDFILSLLINNGIDQISVKNGIDKNNNPKSSELLKIYPDFQEVIAHTLEKAIEKDFHKTHTLNGLKANFKELLKEEINSEVKVVLNPAQIRTLNKDGKIIVADEADNQRLISTKKKFVAENVQKSLQANAQRKTKAIEEAEAKGKLAETIKETGQPLILTFKRIKDDKREEVLEKLSPIIDQAFEDLKKVQQALKQSLGEIHKAIDEISVDFKEDYKGLTI